MIPYGDKAAYDWVIATESVGLGFAGNSDVLDSNGVCNKTE
jgi:hypothetical protein